MQVMPRKGEAIARELFRKGEFEVYTINDSISPIEVLLKNKNLVQDAYCNQSEGLYKKSPLRNQKIVAPEDPDLECVGRPIYVGSCDNCGVRLEEHELEHILQSANSFLLTFIIVIYIYQHDLVYYKTLLK
jgi:hypothetical protein